MPSPFPGMDPYLESPGLWPDVHARLINAISDVLTERVMDRYVVRIEERLYIDRPFRDDEARVRVADVAIGVRGGPRGAMTGGAQLASSSSSMSSVAVAEVDVAEPIEIVGGGGVEVREGYLTIRDRADRAVVTVIEVLSPANKARGPGLASYTAKREEVLASDASLVEIDLLREGVRCEPSARGRVGVGHQYEVFVSRATARPRGLVWPIRLDQRLPVIPVPLRGDDPDAPLGLRAALDLAYDRARYDLDLDYEADPDPPLDEAWSAWADAVLRAKGRRGTRTSSEVADER
jgi:hypothetical protein